MPLVIRKKKWQGFETLPLLLSTRYFRLDRGSLYLLSQIIRLPGRVIPEPSSKGRGDERTEKIL